VKTGTIQDFLGSLRPGQRVFFQGGTGECLQLYNALRDDPGVASGIEFWSCLIPGINGHDYGSLPGNVRLVTFMASPALEPSIAIGQTELRPMAYSEIGETLAAMEFDAVLLHAAPPDDRGQCSFGIACDTPALVWPRAKYRAVFLNRAMPSLSNADSIPSEKIDLAIEINEPLSAPPEPKPGKSAALDSIAQTAAALVPNDCIIQCGIGDTPAAIASALRFHRGLSVHSGIITPEYQQLAEAGAIDLFADNVTGIAWGGPDFHAWLKTSGFRFLSIPHTHAHGALAMLPRFVSIGSAIEVDLAGNLNLEWRMSRRISSVGGAIDYMRAAAVSEGGLSIIALQAASGGASRIVPSIANPTIPAEFADAIVTEHGVARLKGLSPRQRAEALIAIAAPEHQGFLQREAEALLGRAR
jgi:acyl-CoA hydrolase